MDYHHVDSLSTRLAGQTRTMHCQYGGQALTLHDNVLMPHILFDEEVSHHLRLAATDMSWVSTIGDDGDVPFQTLMM